MGVRPQVRLNRVLPSLVCGFYYGLANIRDENFGGGGGYMVDGGYTGEFTVTKHNRYLKWSLLTCWTHTDFGTSANPSPRKGSLC